MNKTITSLIFAASFATAVAQESHPGQIEAPARPDLSEIFDLLGLPNETMEQFFKRHEGRPPLEELKVFRHNFQKQDQVRKFFSFKNIGQPSPKLLNKEESTKQKKLLLGILTARNQEQDELANLDEILSGNRNSETPSYLDQANSEIRLLQARGASLNQEMILLFAKKASYRRIFDGGTGEEDERMKKLSPEGENLRSDLSLLIESDLAERHALLMDETAVLIRHRHVIASNTLERLKSDLLNPAITDSGQRKRLVDAVLTLENRKDKSENPLSKAERENRERVKEKPLPIYLELPLLQPKFHWFFTPAEQFMSCDIGLTLEHKEGQGKTEEISILKAGKLNPDWSIWKKTDALGIRSTRGYITSAKTRATLRFKTDRDLHGGSGGNRGVLPAGEYRAKGFPEIFWNAPRNPDFVEYASLGRREWDEWWVLEPVKPTTAFAKGEKGKPTPDFWNPDLFELDRNGDTSITEEEAGPGNWEELRRFNKNGDDKVTLEEIFFVYADKNSDGKVTRDEIAADWKDLVERGVDLDQDGSITKEEFKSILKSNTAARKNSPEIKARSAEIGEQ